MVVNREHLHVMRDALEFVVANYQASGDIVGETRRAAVARVVLQVAAQHDEDAQAIAARVWGALAAPGGRP